MTLIWLGLAISILGTFLLLIFGLVVSGDSTIVRLGYWAGVALMTVGLTVSIVLT